MKNRKESGVLVVEASIVFPVMFLVIFFMIFAGNAYLQKCRVESIINQGAIDGAAYCADPQLRGAESGSFPSVGDIEIYPYRFFSSSGVGDVAGEIDAQISEQVANMSSGLFSNMKPTNFVVQSSYSNGILYATFSVDASYKIRIPVRLLGQTENIHLEVSTHVEMPVSDSVEMIRNIDMVWDYMERTGAAEEIQKAIGEAKSWFNRS